MGITTFLMGEKAMPENHEDQVSLSRYQRYWLANKEKIKARNRAYYHAHRERLRIDSKKYVAENHTEIRARERQAYAENRESRLGKRRAYRTANPEYCLWRDMRYRCECPTKSGYPHYGGRGIFVCERWQTFENFLVDMGPRPSPTHSIERRDNDGPYSPENCCWADKTTQQRNKRNNSTLTWNGETHCLAEWAELVHISQKVLSRRKNLGWTTEAILTTPVKHNRKVP
jgi:hypothetical protein